MDTIIITFQNGTEKEYRKGIKFSEIIEDVKKDYQYDILIGKFKNQIIQYNDSLVKSGTLYLYDLSSRIGNKVYERGLTYLFICATKMVLGRNTEIKIRHSIDKGIYCEINNKLDEQIVAAIKAKMLSMVEQGLPFVKMGTSRLEAIEYFRNNKQEDKAKTLSYNTSQFITLYKIDGMYNYLLGDLPNDASVIKYFDLTLIKDRGIVICLPSVFNNGQIVPYTHHEQFFNSLEEYAKWGEILHINNVGDLNETISKGNSGELINLAENIQNYKLTSIAEEIVKRKNEIKIILISGPSSSGKTTTSKKLSLYLKTLGLNPCPLSIDDYFLNRCDTPLDEKGNPNYECTEAIDINLFNDQLTKLLNHEKVMTPVFNFVKGEKVFEREIELAENDILIVEGLHALNDVLTKTLKKENKYKIYISPLAFLNIDNDNRISMTDIRLLRRMIRDNRSRGYNASQTLKSWPDVRKGEEKYVFPYQDQADVIFNSSLVYELGVLKTYVEPLLFSVTETDDEYLTALSLIELLKYILPIPSDNVPANSILREFIGGSYFE